MLEIGRKRGCIISGGNIDEEKTARILLDEFKNGIIGKITIEQSGTFPFAPFGAIGDTSIKQFFNYFNLTILCKKC